LRAFEPVTGAAKSEATRRAYASDFRSFETWCRDHEANPLPASPVTLATYITALADTGKKVSTIRRPCVAITYLRAPGCEPDPMTDQVKDVLAGIRRTLGVKPERKAPVTVETIKRMMRLIPGSLIGTRDRALLLVGFAGALRRSELVALQVADLERRNEGLA